MGNDEMEIDEENVMNQDDAELMPKHSKRKGNIIYSKYVDPKYLEYPFKLEELDELSTAEVYYFNIVCSKKTQKFHAACRIYHKW